MHLVPPIPAATETRSARSTLRPGKLKICDHRKRPVEAGSLGRLRDALRGTRSGQTSPADGCGVVYAGTSIYAGADLPRRRYEGAARYAEFACACVEKFRHC